MEFVMSLKTQNSTLIGMALIALIVLTRSSHFGTSFLLPDATIAALFLTGMLMQKIRWLAIAIAVAFAVDFYALGFAGVADYCMSLGYWGLIPTYAMVWGVGRYIAKQEKPFAVQVFVTAALMATSLAFVLSNAFWYAFSDKVNSLTITEFSARVAPYFTPYLGYTVFYLGSAWLAQAAFKKLAMRQSTLA
jgi:hypothetical protein